MILHKRLLTNEYSDLCNNLWAIEFKGYWNRRKNDLEKLCKLTDNAFGYYYQLGSFVKLTLLHLVFATT